MTNKFYNLLDKIGIKGKKDVRFLTIFYLIALILVFLVQGEDVPIKPIHLILLPFVFFSGAFALYSLKCFFFYFKAKLSKPFFIVFCAIMLLLWTSGLAIVADSIDKRDMKQFISFLVVLLSVAVFMSCQILIPWIGKVINQRKGYLRFYLIHLPIVALTYGFLLQSKLIDLVQISSTPFINNFIFWLAIQIAIYCGLSFVISLRLLLVLSFSLFDKR